jgi:hypothetical protein
MIFIANDCIILQKLSLPGLMDARWEEKEELWMRATG